MSVQLWSLTITTELNDEGEVDCSYEISGEPTIGELVGYIEVVQQQIIQGTFEGDLDEN
jgi:hypothetical protein